MFDHRRAKLFKNRSLKIGRFSKMYKFGENQNFGKKAP